MTSPERVSNGQVVAVVVASRLSLTLMHFGADPVVRQDVWWQNIFDALLTVLVAWVLSHLWQRFPGKSLMQVMRTLLGRVVGTLVALLVVIVILLTLCATLRMAGEVMTIVTLPRTPPLVVIACLAAVAAWGARHGVEVLGRSAQIVFPVLAGAVVLIFLMLLPQVRFDRLLPFEVVRTGPLPHLKSMFSVVARTGELICIGVMVPFIRSRQKLFHLVAVAETWLAVLWVLMSISIFGILGGEIQSFPFPWITAIRATNLPEFVERIDGLVLAVWVLGMYVRVALFLWAAAVGLSHSLGVRNYRLTVLPLAGMATVYAMLQAESLTELLDYLRQEVFAPYMLTFILVIPVILLVVALLRGQGSSPTAAKK